MRLQQPDLSRFNKPRELLTACGGFYECPRDSKGHRIGPLVGYAGRDEERRQFVGDVFVNVATFEQWPDVLDRCVIAPLQATLRRKFSGVELVYCGAPEGGKTVAVLLARRRRARYIYPEKIEVAPATETSRAVTELKFARHTVRKGDKVVIVEDVCNNFSTTAKLIQEISILGGTVVAIVCFLNRSMFVRENFDTDDGSYPVYAFWDEAMPEYRQDDFEVAGDVAAGKVVWQPKLEWSRLMEFMKAA